MASPVWVKLGSIEADALGVEGLQQRRRQRPRGDIPNRPRPSRSAPLGSDPSDRYVRPEGSAAIGLVEIPVDQDRRVGREHEHARPASGAKGLDIAQRDRGGRGALAYLADGSDEGLGLIGRPIAKEGEGDPQLRCAHAAKRRVGQGLSSPCVNAEPHRRRKIESDEQPEALRRISDCAGSGVRSEGDLGGTALGDAA